MTTKESENNSELNANDERPKWVWEDEKPGYKKLEILEEEDLGTHKSVSSLLDAELDADIKRLEKTKENK